MGIVEACMIADGSEDADEDTYISAIQLLISSGVISHLQGSVQRTAAALIEEGICFYR